MSWYNITNASQATSIITILSTANSISYGWFGIMILIGFFFITFFAMKEYNTKAAGVSAALLTAIIGMLLRTMNLIPDIAWYVAILIAALAGAWIVLEEE